MSGVRVQWYADRVAAITVGIPQRAHAIAAQQAAGLSAREIKSKATGTLARDVSQAKPAGFMRSIVGSNLPYAAMENFGGTITPVRAKRLLIRGTRGGNTRSTHGGDIVASASSVEHRGKDYLQVAVGAFPGLYMAALRRLMP
jgi:phage gpG-like protein